MVVVLPYAPLHFAPGTLFDMTKLGSESNPALSQLSYPLAAVVMGYFWPQISAFTITLGRGNEKTLRLGLGQLRDYLLGGPALGPLNARLSLAVASYLDRVVAAATQKDDDSARLILDALGLSNLATDQHQLRDALLKKAAEDCEALYAAVGSVKMIPFVERRRPLMLVPDMTTVEEELLYQAGIETPGHLLRADPIVDCGISPQRLAVLRLGARRLMAQRLWFGFSLAGIAGAVVALASFSWTMRAPETTPQQRVPSEKLSPPPAFSSNAERHP
jgi:hypothetical protein